MNLSAFTQLHAEPCSVIDPDRTAQALALLDARDRGRRRAIEKRQRRAATLADLVRRVARIDAAEQPKPRGRAERVSLALALKGVSVTPRHVRTILEATYPSSTPAPAERARFAESSSEDREP